MDYRVTSDAGLDDVQVTGRAGEQPWKNEIEGPWAAQITNHYHDIGRTFWRVDRARDRALAMNLLWTRTR